VGEDEELGDMFEGDEGLRPIVGGYEHAHIGAEGAWGVVHGVEFALVERGDGLVDVIYSGRRVRVAGRSEFLRRSPHERSGGAVVGRLGNEEDSEHQR